MKDKVIETAGRAWKLLGEKGKISIAEIPKLLDEKEAVVYQSIGWLAREDKINYDTKNKKSYVSLVESELSALKNTIQNIQSQAAVKNKRTSPKKSTRRI